jgi:hypothetical protein
MKQKLMLLTAAATLAFAGFGCGEKAPMTGAPGSSPDGGSASQAEVDSAVDDIIDRAAKTNEISDPTGDVEFLDDDENAVGDYMITSYETE